MTTYELILENTYNVIPLLTNYKYHCLQITNTAYPRKIAALFPPWIPVAVLGGGGGVKIFPGADCHQSSTIPPLCLSRAPPWLLNFISQQIVSHYQTFNWLILVNVLYHCYYSLSCLCVVIKKVDYLTVFSYRLHPM